MLLVINIIILIALGVVSIFAILVGLGFFDDPDGKESNPEYWKTLKMMRAREEKEKEKDE